MISVDFEKNLALETDSSGTVLHEYPLDTPEAFALVSKAWLRAGWDVKHVYTFSWMGRPIIQLPEDMVRIQELIYAVKPDVLIETGIAHGGSLIYYASLLKAMGKGRVVGVDIEIRPHNRVAIEQHELFPLLTLIEGSSTDSSIVEKVATHIQPNDTVMVILDSNHTYAHVLAELNAYAPFVTSGSYIIAMDGIMQQVVGAPRTKDDWGTNNPITAVQEFVASNPQFEIVEPPFEFNESFINQRITYAPSGILRRTEGKLS
jgi:cephalosporin hydroxylase